MDIIEQMNVACEGMLSRVHTIYIAYLNGPKNDLTVERMKQWASVVGYPDVETAKAHILGMISGYEEKYLDLKARALHLTPTNAREFPKKSKLDVAIYKVQVIYSPRAKIVDTLLFEKNPSFEGRNVVAVDVIERTTISDIIRDLGFKIENRELGDDTTALRKDAIKFCRSFIKSNMQKFNVPSAAITIYKENDDDDKEWLSLDEDSCTVCGTDVYALYPNSTIPDEDIDDASEICDRISALAGALDRAIHMNPKFKNYHAYDDWDKYEGYIAIATK